MSCYLPRFLPDGSWNDSQVVCNNHGSYLWTIGSHEEWHYIFRKTTKNLYRYYRGNNSNSDGIFDPLLSTHFFIGLVRPNPGQIDVKQVSVHDLSNYLNIQCSIANDLIFKSVKSVCIMFKPYRFKLYCPTVSIGTKPLAYLNARRVKLVKYSGGCKEVQKPYTALWKVNII